MHEDTGVESAVGVDAGSAGRMERGGSEGAVVVSTATMKVESLAALCSVWPRVSLSENPVRGIRAEIRCRGAISCPVIVRRERGMSRGGAIQEIVAGEHRVKAAVLEGLSEISVLVLTATRAEAKVWVLREGVSPGVARGLLERAWQIERWIRESGFSGSQKEFAVLLGISESTLSEFRRFARSLPEDRVRELASSAGAEIGLLASATRRDLRLATRAGEREAFELLRRVAHHLKGGEDPREAWRRAFRSDALPDPTEPSFGRTRRGIRDSIREALIGVARSLGGFLDLHRRLVPLSREGRPPQHGPTREERP